MSEWQKLTLSAPKRDGSTSDVVLLRPTWWVKERNATIGNTVYISVPECGIDGNAAVLNIEPSPEIGDGPGRVVTGTFKHRVASSIALTIDGEPDPIGCTGNHPFWSATNQDFVRADSLKAGEQLRTTTGVSRVNLITPIPGETFVYNVEVHGTHVYRIGYGGVLVHNGNCPHIVYRAVSLGDLARIENGLGIAAKGTGGSIAQHVAGDSTRYISASQTLAGTNRFNDYGVIAIDVGKAIDGGAGFVAHNNVLQAVARDGLPKHLQNASRALEVMFKDFIPFDAIQIVK